MYIISRYTTCLLYILISLQLRDVKVYRSDPDSSAMKYADESGEFRRVLERFPLRFSFQDGVVEDLCPAEGENVWALNIKRGVLTVLQNSMDSLEHDQRVQEVGKVWGLVLEVHSNVLHPIRGDACVC